MPTRTGDLMSGMLDDLARAGIGPPQIAGWAGVEMAMVRRWLARTRRMTPIQRRRVQDLHQLVVVEEGSALAIALAMAGGVARLASAIGQPAAAVAAWDRTPPEHAAAVSQVSGVPVERLLADAGLAQAELGSCLALRDSLAAELARVEGRIARIAA